MSQKGQLLLPVEVAHCCPHESLEKQAKGNTLNMVQKCNKADLEAQVEEMSWDWDAEGINLDEMMEIYGCH